MSAGGPGDDTGGEPTPAQDPWSPGTADFGQPEPGAAPAQPTQPAPSAQPTQPFPSGQPTQPFTSAQPTEPAPTPPEPGGFASAAPAEWSAPADWTAPEPQPTGNGFGPAGADPWPAQPSADASAGQHGDPSSGQFGAPPPGRFGAPPPGQYSYPTYYTPAARRTSPVAIAALVCGLVQFFLGLFALNFLLAIPAIICGGIGMRQTRQRGEGGRGLAIAGLVLGILGIVWNVLYVVLLGYIGAHFRPGSGHP
jgi:hypothetical protein